MSQLQIAIIPVTAFQQNCTLIWDGDSKEGVVVDPGGDVERIEAAIEETGMSVKAIWLTHGHIDHAAGAMDLKDKLGVQIIGPHKDDEPLLQGLEKQAQMFGLDGAVRNCTPDRWLEEGETLTIADHKFEVFHCPGHAPGHVVRPVVARCTREHDVLELHVLGVGQFEQIAADWEARSRADNSVTDRHALEAGDRDRCQWRGWFGCHFHIVQAWLRGDCINGPSR